MFFMCHGCEKIKQILFFLLISFAFCSCQEYKPCDINDGECQKDALQAYGSKKAYTGVPEAHIQLVDPLELKPATASLLGFSCVTLTKGQVEGIGKCIFKTFKTNVDARYQQVSIISCPKITIRGRYKIESAPIMGNICGWCNIHGEGNGTIVIENWLFKFCYNFIFEKRCDGIIYLRPFFNNATHEASEAKATVSADCIRNGNRDITRRVVNFINNNWKTIMCSYVGQFIYDLAAKYYFDIYELLYKYFPASTFFTNDLNPLVAKNCSC